MAHTHNGHNHNSDGEEKSNIGLAFFLNLSFTVIELFGGLFTNSIAIISDAIHDFGDSLSLGFAWYFQHLSKKKSNSKYSYGYKRFSILGAIINCVVLIVGSLFILSEAVPRLFNPQETDAKGMFILAILGLIVNGIAVLKTKHGKSINERVVSLHLLEDVLGWAAVLIGSTVMYFTGWTIIDPILSLFISVFVLFNVFNNIKEVLPILLQGTPADIDENHIVDKIKSAESIISDIHDLHIWSLDEDYVVLTAHIILKNELMPDDFTALKKKLRDILVAEGIKHTTIEFETLNNECIFGNCKER